MKTLIRRRIKSLIPDRVKDVPVRRKSRQVQLTNESRYDAQRRYINWRNTQY